MPGTPSAPGSDTSATEKICPFSTLPMEAPQPLCASRGAATWTSWPSLSKATCQDGQRRCRNSIVVGNQDAQERHLR